MQRGDLEEFRSLAGPRRRSLRHDKQQWAEEIASSGERHLLCGEIKDAFANFRRLRRKRTNTSTPLTSMDGKLLSDKASVLSRWQEHFSNLLNRSLHTPAPTLCSEAAASTPDPLIDTFPPTLLETQLKFNYQTTSSSLTQTASLLVVNSSTIQNFHFSGCSRDWKIKRKKFKTCHDFSRKVETLINARTPTLTLAGSWV